MHLFVVPVTMKESRYAGKVRLDEHGKPIMKGVLDAKNIFSPTTIKQLWSDYAEYIEKYGVTRAEGKVIKGLYTETATMDAVIEQKNEMIRQKNEEISKQDISLETKALANKRLANEIEQKSEQVKGLDSDMSHKREQRRDLDLKITDLNAQLKQRQQQADALPSFGLPPQKGLLGYNTKEVDEFIKAAVIKDRVRVASAIKMDEGPTRKQMWDMIQEYRPKVDKDVLDSLYDYIENEFEYVEKYPKILTDNPEAREIRSRGENYMSGIFKEVRAFFNWAHKTKIIDSFPFEGFEMPSERYGSPIYITLDDVQKIYTADLSDFPLLAIQRDIFVFQCNVGCRIGDLLRLKKRDVINGAVEYIPTKAIKENVRTVVVPLNTIAQEIVDRYADLPGDQLLPFESSERYNDNIKIIFEKAGVTYLVTKLDTVTRTEVKVPINEIASSHMARRTFIGNIYKLVKDPNLVSALTGHVEGSRAFTRYRTIDIDMKKDLVKILEGDK